MKSTQFDPKHDIRGKFKMKIDTKIFLIAFATILIASNNIQAQSVIPIEITDQGHILLEAEINNVQGRFLLDTGAGLTAITKDFASQIDGLVKLNRGYTGFRATGERLNIDLYRGNSIAIGGVPLQRSALTIIDADWPIDGIISLMSFRNQPFTIDFENKKLYLESAKSLSERKENGKMIPIQLEDSRGIALDMFTYISVNDTLTLQTSLDSGAGTGVFRINAKYMAMLDVDSTKVNGSYKQSSFKPDEGNIFYETKLNEISVDNFPKIKIEDFNVTFVRGLIYDAIVPIGWLGNQITIDLANEVMIIQ